MGIGKNANLVRGLEIQEAIRLISQTIFFRAFEAFFFCVYICVPEVNYFHGRRKRNGNGVR